MYTTQKMTKVLEFRHFYPHVVFRISPEGYRKKEMVDYIPVKVFLDLETVYTINEYEIDEEI